MSDAQTFDQTESHRLEGIASWFSSFGGYDARLTEFRVREVSPYFTGESCLELGSADGMMTGVLVDHFKRVTAVEGSAALTDALRTQVGDVDKFTVINSLFEHLALDEKFDTIIAANIFEHVDSPVEIMTLVHKWIAPGGRFIVQVPNALSFHRLFGVKMGMLADPHELNETDHRLGHRRVYDLDILSEDARAAGWNVEVATGGFFKVLANSQMEAMFNDEMHEATYQLGKDFPRHGAFITVVCAEPGDGSAR